MFVSGPHVFSRISEKFSLYKLLAISSQDHGQEGSICLDQIPHIDTDEKFFHPFVFEHFLIKKIYQRVESLLPTYSFIYWRLIYYLFSKRVDHFYYVGNQRRVDIIFFHSFPEVLHKNVVIFFLDLDILVCYFHLFSFIAGFD